jgi:hypothetical protein
MSFVLLYHDFLQQGQDGCFHRPPGQCRDADSVRAYYEGVTVALGRECHMRGSGTGCALLEESEKALVRERLDRNIFPRGNFDGCLYRSTGSERLLTIRPYTAEARNVDRKRFSGVKYLVAVPDMIGATGNTFAVGDDKSANGLLNVLRRVAVQ